MKATREGTPMLLRRCVGTPPAGLLACPAPATHWQVREWGQGTGVLYPAHLDLCAVHAAATADRSDVMSAGSY